jgi:hypothetical protein
MSIAITDQNKDKIKTISRSIIVCLKAILDQDKIESIVARHVPSELNIKNKHDLIDNIFEILRDDTFKTLIEHIPVTLKEFRLFNSGLDVAKSLDPADKQLMKDLFDSIKSCELDFMQQFNALLSEEEQLVKEACSFLTDYFTHQLAEILQETKTWCDKGTLGDQSIYANPTYYANNCDYSHPINKSECSSVSDELDLPLHVKEVVNEAIRVTVNDLKATVNDLKSTVESLRVSIERKNSNANVAATGTPAAEETSESSNNANDKANTFSFFSYGKYFGNFVYSHMAVPTPIKRGAHSFGTLLWGFKSTVESKFAHIAGHAACNDLPPETGTIPTQTPTTANNTAEAANKLAIA